MPARDLPQPPYDLATRVGSLADAADPMVFYDHIGESVKRDIEDALPAGTDLAGRRVLDFGCGAGRTLRHFVSDGKPTELWGCDIHGPSIAWLSSHLSPPLHVFVNGATPPLPHPDEFFDVIYCVSVFTHLTSSWSEWLLELHRVLKADGVLLVTFMGEGQSQVIAGEPWDENRVGMLILSPGQSWDLGGPMVLHSPWWIAEHWGRLFNVIRLLPHGFASPDGQGQGIVTLTKKPVAVTPNDLRKPGPDVREATSLAHNVHRLCRELEEQQRPTTTTRWWRR